ncbi:MAG: HIT family hydrolase [Idiomarinaceae bacterium HL-53]|nr:MAG: HIT family hydrolase [Idiomarinaceae bacterium HL-53]CUS49412.1 Diadenosine tetraphosphate (Ap4A) hydrolase [Idiomarinaceae bacterium HL-53]
MHFELHEQLAKDTEIAGDFPLSRVCVMNDENFPWVILVPRVPNVREIYELQAMEQQQLLQESSRLGMWLMREFNGDKLNIGALGNMVPQLHVHHIVRFESDPAWPAPVWGKCAANPYSSDAIEQFAGKLRAQLKLRSIA